MFKYREPTEKQLTGFGVGATILLGALGAYAWYRGADSQLYWFAGAALFLTMTFSLRRALSAVYRAWMYFGMALGWMNLHILMALALYLVFTPIRLIQKALGRDPLRRAFDDKRASYLEERKPLEKDHFERMH